MGDLQFFMPGVRDAFEIAVVAWVIYRLLLFLGGTRGIQIMLGLVLLAGVYVAAFALNLSMISYLLGVVFTYGAFAAIVIFQPELRNALARLGQSPPLRLFGRSDAFDVADEIAEAVDRLARAGTGAIVAVEADVGLSEYVQTGTPMDAKVSADLLATIFTPYSPLHDGAVLVRGERVIGAGVILPLTQFPVRDRSLGTRHRAALGLSEETDAIVIVVSEETSTISIAKRGLLHRGLSVQQVRDTLGGRALAVPATRLETASGT